MLVILPFSLTAACQLWMQFLSKATRNSCFENAKSPHPPNKKFLFGKTLDFARYNTSTQTNNMYWNQ